MPHYAGGLNSRSLVIILLARSLTVWLDKSKHHMEGTNGRFSHTHTYTSGRHLRTYTLITPRSRSSPLSTYLWVSHMLPPKASALPSRAFLPRGELLRNDMRVVPRRRVQTVLPLHACLCVGMGAWVCVWVWVFVIVYMLVVRVEEG